MQTKVIYTLVSNSNDFLLEQLILSVFSLKKRNKCHVSVVVDSDTEKSLHGNRHKLYEVVDEIFSITVPEEFSQIQKSRYLKTQLRKFVSGDFLFLDCDTIICGKLDNIDKLAFNIAAVADVNGPLALSDQNTISRCQQAGFNNVKGLPYFNSGVMFVKDNSETHRFFQEWHKQWLNSLEHGVHLDQPALCQANSNMNFAISELPCFWNYQVNFHGCPQFDKAIILHYAGGSNKQSMRQLFSIISNEPNINGTTIEKLLAPPRNTLFTLMTITDNSFLAFCTSESIYFHQNSPSAYRLFTHILKLAQPIFKAFAKLKSKF